jgi:hypothetical protein
MENLKLGLYEMGALSCDTTCDSQETAKQKNFFVRFSADSIYVIAP